MSAQMDHERIEELIAARALGGLDPDDHREFARLRAEHGDCSLCQAYEIEYAEVAGRLGLALDPAPIRAGLEDELVESARGSVAFLGARRGRRGLMPGPRDHVKGWLAAVAAAFALLAGAAGGYLVGHQTGPAPVVATFEGPGAGTLAAAFVPGSDETVIIGAGLEAPPAGKTYELWKITGDTPEPAGTFEPTDGRVVIRIPTDPSGADLIAVTMEVDGGVDTPTGEILYSAEIPV